MLRQRVNQTELSEGACLRFGPARPLGFGSKAFFLSFHDWPKVAVMEGKVLDWERPQSVYGHQGFYRLMVNGKGWYVHQSRVFSQRDKAEIEARVWADSNLKCQQATSFS